MENVYKALDAVVDTIVQSKDYQTCISLKEQMADNEEITSLIENIKKTQKKYIRSEYDSKVKEELDSYQQQLMEIPIYHIYNDSLEKVNEMIELVKDTLNQYFDSVLNG